MFPFFLYPSGGIVLEMFVAISRSGLASGYHVDGSVTSSLYLCISVRIDRVCGILFTFTLRGDGFLN